jgi:hypothetical protein
MTPQICNESDNREGSSWEVHVPRDIDVSLIVGGLSAGIKGSRKPLSSKIDLRSTTIAQSDPMAKLQMGDAMGCIPK